MIRPMPTVSIGTLAVVEVTKDVVTKWPSNRASFAAVWTQVSCGWRVVWTGSQWGRL